MNDSVVKLFCKKVGKRLRCMPDTKQVLLQGLSDELSERPHPDTASIAAIESNIGTIDQVRMLFRQPYLQRNCSVSQSETGSERS